MRMVRWMCGVKLKDRLPRKELRERLGIDDIALVLQKNRLRWYGHVLRKDDDDCVKKCMEHEVQGPRPRGRPKRTWREVVQEDCQACKLNKEDAMDRCKWRKVIKDVRWSGWVWVGECFFWYRPTRVVPDKRPLNGCVCVCVRACVHACVRACVRVCNASVNLADRHSEHLIYQLCFRVCTDSKNYCLLPFVLYVDGKVLALSLPWNISLQDWESYLWKR